MALADARRPAGAPPTPSATAMTALAGPVARMPAASSLAPSLSGAPRRIERQTAAGYREQSVREIVVVEEHTSFVSLQSFVYSQRRLSKCWRKWVVVGYRFKMSERFSPSTIALISRGCLL